MNKKNCEGKMTLTEEQTFIQGLKDKTIPFEEAIEQYQGLIWHQMRKFLPIAGYEVADVYSILMYVTYDCIGKFEIESGNRFSTYLTTALYHRLCLLKQVSQRVGSGAVHYEKAERLDRPILVGSNGEGDTQTVGELFLKTEITSELDTNYLNRCLWEAISLEDERYQTFIRLLYVEELTLKEIGEMYGICGAAVRNCITKRFPKIRRRLESMGINAEFLK